MAESDAEAYESKPAPPLSQSFSLRVNERLEGIWPGAEALTKHRNTGRLVLSDQYGTNYHLKQLLAHTNRGTTPKVPSSTASSKQKVPPAPPHYLQPTNLNCGVTASQRKTDRIGVSSAQHATLKHTDTDTLPSRSALELTAANLRSNPVQQQQLQVPSSSTQPVFTASRPVPPTDLMATTSADPQAGENQGKPKPTGIKLKIKLGGGVFRTENTSTKDTSAAVDAARIVRDVLALGVKATSHGQLLSPAPAEWANVSLPVEPRAQPSQPPVVLETQASSGTIEVHESTLLAAHAAGRANEAPDAPAMQRKRKADAEPASTQTARSSDKPEAKKPFFIPKLGAKNGKQPASSVPLQSSMKPSSSSGSDGPAKHKPSPPVANQDSRPANRSPEARSTAGPAQPMASPPPQPPPVAHISGLPSGHSPTGSPKRQVKHLKVEVAGEHSLPRNNRKVDDLSDVATPDTVEPPAGSVPRDPNGRPAQQPAAGPADDSDSDMSIDILSTDDNKSITNSIPNSIPKPTPAPAPPGPATVAAPQPAMPSMVHLLSQLSAEDKQDYRKLMTDGKHLKQLVENSKDIDDLEKVVFRLRAGLKFMHGAVIQESMRDDKGGFKFPRHSVALGYNQCKDWFTRGCSQHLSQVRANDLFKDAVKLLAERLAVLCHMRAFNANRPRHRQDKIVLMTVLEDTRRRREAEEKLRQAKGVNSSMHAAPSPPLHKPSPSASNTSGNTQSGSREQARPDATSKQGAAAKPPVHSGSIAALSHLELQGPQVVEAFKQNLNATDQQQKLFESLSRNAADVAAYMQTAVTSGHAPAMEAAMYCTLVGLDGGLGNGHTLVNAARNAIEAISRIDAKA